MTAPLVLVHGCGRAGAFWNALVAALPDVTVHAPSLPGRPPTGGAPRHSAAEHAAWLAAWIADARLPPPIVVGHSFGGAIALELALAGTALAGLVLVSTGARLRVHPDILAAVDAAVAEGTPADLTEVCFLPTTSPDLIANEEAAALDVPPATTAADWHATNRFDRLLDLHTLDVPTLVVGGTADLLTKPKYAEHLATQIPGARLHLVDGAGHMLPCEHPAELAAAITDFLTAR